MLGQACYSFDPWARSSVAPHYDRDRELNVGSTLQLQAEVTPTMVKVTSAAVPQCHHAKFGTTIEQQHRSGTPSFWAHASWFLFVSGIDAGFIGLTATEGKDTGLLVTGLVGIGATSGYLLIYLGTALMGHPVSPWFMSSVDSQDRSIPLGPASTWEGDTHACGAPAGYPSVPVSIIARFPRTQRSIMWRGTTGNDDALALQITQTIQAVAHYCGTPHVEIGQLVDKDKQPPNADEGTPESPRIIIHNATDLVVDVSGDLALPLERISDPWSRQVATECQQAVLNACASNMGQGAGAAARDACADQCATNLVGDICVLKRRNCLAVMSGPSDKVYCDQGLDRCVTENKGSLADFESCKKQCFDQAVAASCH
jgi:hypothetical protein